MQAPLKVRIVMLKQVLLISALIANVAHAVDLIKSDRRQKEFIAGLALVSPHNLHLTSFRSQKQHLQLVIVYDGSMKTKNNHGINVGIYFFDDDNDKNPYDNLICQICFPEKGINDVFSICQKIPPSYDSRIGKDAFINAWTNGETEVSLTIADKICAANKTIQLYEFIKFIDKNWFRISRKGNPPKYTRTLLPMSKDEIDRRYLAKIYLPNDFDVMNILNRKSLLSLEYGIQKTNSGWLFNYQNKLTFYIFEHFDSLFVAAILAKKPFMIIQAKRNQIITQYDFENHFSKFFCNRVPFEFYSVSFNQETKFMTRFVLNKLTCDDWFSCCIFKF